MKELTILLSIGIFLITSSCVPKKTIADTGCPKYKSEDFKRNDISINGLAVMPETGPGENELRSSPLRDEINVALREEFGDSMILSSNQVITMINEGDLAADYTMLVTELQSSGIIPRELLALIGNIAGVDYLLFVKLLPDSYDKNGNRIELRELFVQTRILSVSGGEVVWEGTGGYAAYKEPTVNVTKESAKSIVQMIGNNPDEGPCETTDEIIASVRSARSKSAFGLIVGGVLAVLLLPVLFTWKVV